MSRRMYPKGTLSRPTVSKSQETGLRGSRLPHDTGHCDHACWYCLRDWPRRNVGSDMVKSSLTDVMGESQEASAMELDF